MSTDPRSWLVALALLGCTRPDAQEAGDEVDWPEPELCEVRQIADEGELAGPGDLEAICDGAGTRVVGFRRPDPVPCTVSNEPCSDPSSCGDCEALVGPGAVCTEGGNYGCECIMPCSTDEDCASDEACVCRSGVVTTEGLVPISVISADVTGCFDATCRRDADCDPGQTCSKGSPSLCEGGYHPRLRCIPAESSCSTDLDCPEQEVCGSLDAGAPWQCFQPTCGP